MCGIIGAYPIPNTDLVINGLKKLKHRGPDDDGWVETPTGTFGHTRLSIIDVDSGQQPMRSGESLIVFNGEIYNYSQLRSLLKVPFSTQSDTEVVLQLYQQLGPESISLLNGMFSLAITNGENIFLARDPLGIKPLYYTASEGVLYFASEIKALLEITSDVQEFPAGHWWHSRLGLSKYYQIEKAEIFSPGLPRDPRPEDFSAIRRSLRAAVEKRMVADTGVPVGVSLSGGLDSSIVAALARQGREDLETFVVGVPGSQDLAVSKQVSGFLGTRHHVYAYTFQEMVDALPEVIYHLESFDAALVRSAIPNFFLAKLASEHVKVILTGEGADELYAGYQYLEPVSDPAQLQKELYKITGSLHNTNLQRADRMSMAHGLEARVPFLDKDFVDFSFQLPPVWKLQSDGRSEKDLLRRSFEGLVPLEILNRPKQKFSDGAGSIGMMAEYANSRISADEFQRYRQVSPQVTLRSKEEMLYYQIFEHQFGESFPPEMVGRTRSVTKNELN